MSLFNSYLASVSRSWRGTVAYRRQSQPAKTLVLYEYEGCPYCRLVRECLTELDLDVIIYPSPKGETVNRNALKTIGGKLQFPYLIDANTGTQMYESGDIVSYLRKQYKMEGRQPPAFPKGVRNMLSSYLASVLSFGHGTRYAKPTATNKQHLPKQLLELYSFESSPYSRIVRERLAEYGIPYLLRNLGKQQKADSGPASKRKGEYTPAPGTKREALLAVAGKVQVPYLIDPNTDTRLFEAKDILEYLKATYRA